jgi:hypothetical protein
LRSDVALYRAALASLATASGAADEHFALREPFPARRSQATRSSARRARSRRATRSAPRACSRRRGARAGDSLGLAAQEEPRAGTARAARRTKAVAAHRRLAHDGGRTARAPARWRTRRFAEARPRAGLLATLARGARSASRLLASDPDADARARRARARVRARASRSPVAHPGPHVAPPEARSTRARARQLRPRRGRDDCSGAGACCEPAAQDRHARRGAAAAVGDGRAGAPVTREAIEAQARVLDARQDRRIAALEACPRQPVDRAAREGWAGRI